MTGANDESRSWFRSIHVVNAMAPYLVPGKRMLKEWLGHSTQGDQQWLFQNRPPTWQRSVAALSEISGLVHNAGIRCEAILLPGNYSYQVQRPFHDITLETCQSAGIPACTLLDSFIHTGRSPERYGLNLIDNHPSAEYCRVAAEAIYQRLRENGLLDGLMAGTARLSPGRS